MLLMEMTKRLQQEPMEAGVRRMRATSFESPEKFTQEIA
jgi:hypothetical protein